MHYPDWVTSIARAIIPLLSVTASLPLALATPKEVLSQEAIASYREKLSLARNGQSVIQQGVGCLASREAEMISERDHNQFKLGELRGHEQNLKTDVAAGHVTYEAFDRELKSQEARLQQLRRELTDLQYRKAAQEEELRQCKKKPLIPNFMCDLSNSVAHLIGAFSDLDASIEAADRQLNGARDGINEASQRRDQSQTELDKAIAATTALDMDIRRTEREIGALQGDLSILRSGMQSYNTLLDEFKNALNQSERVVAADERAITARRIRDIEMKIDQSTQQLSAAIDHARLTLPKKAVACLTQ